MWQVPLTDATGQIEARQGMKVREAQCKDQ